MVGVLDVAVSVIDMDLVYLIVIPLFFSIATIWKYWKSFMSTDRLRSMIFCFILIEFFQSSTLYPDIHPQISSSVQSHLLKYWYYNSKDSLMEDNDDIILNPLTEDFKQIVLERNENILNDLPSLIDSQTNVVIIILESFRANEIGAYGSELGLTPNFDKYSKQGILFSRIFSSLFLSRVGLWAILCGAHRYPNDFKHVLQIGRKQQKLFFQSGTKMVLIFKNVCSG